MTIRVPLSLKLQIEMAANNDGRTVNSFVNKVLKDYIKNEKKQGQEINPSPLSINQLAPF